MHFWLNTLLCPHQNFFAPQIFPSHHKFRSGYVPAQMDPKNQVFERLTKGAIFFVILAHA